MNPKAMDALEGVAMELEDCAFPTLKSIVVTDDPNQAFDGCNWALWSAPFRAARAWSARNCSAATARSSSARARRWPPRRPADVRILVVGNPCNTNCLVAYRNGKAIPAERWSAMTRLDHNRAVAALAKKAGVPNEAVTCVTIWGNHSNTQYPDFTNAKINGKPAPRSSPTAPGWKRLRPAVPGTRQGDHQQARPELGVFGRQRGDRSRQEPAQADAGQRLGQRGGRFEGEYGVPAGLVFGYPCKSDGKGQLEHRRWRETRRLRLRRSFRKPRSRNCWKSRMRSKGELAADDEP
jgi:malate dehydrogenase